MESKKRVRIDLKEEKDSKKATASKRSYSSVSHRSTVLEEQKEFEFTPVISPIFGASDVETDKAKKNTSVLLPKSKKAKSTGNSDFSLLWFGGIRGNGGASKRGYSA